MELVRSLLGGGMMMKPALAMSLLLAACATDSGPTDPSGGGDGKADSASEPDAATRAKILSAITSGYLTPAVHGQAAVLTPDSVQVAGDFAWVTGTVAKQGGGEIDWTNSDFADAVSEGLFDGPSLQALVHVQDGSWSVSEAGIGPTDVWWDGIWYRFPVSCSLYPGFESCPSVATPQSGTALRKDILGAIHAGGLDASVHGQANQLVVSWFKAGGDYAFVTADVQAAGGGEIDWQNSDYASEIADGLFDGPNLTAIAHKTATGWKLSEWSVGATDVAWYGAWSRLESVPCALFPVDACPAE